MRNFHPWPIFPHNLDSKTARSLSLLFVLQEFLASCQLLEWLQNTIPEKVNDAHLIFNRFFLVSLDNPFSRKGGSLDKLCFYSEILLQASNIEDETILVLLEAMRHSIMKIKSKLVFLGNKASVQDEIWPIFRDVYNELHDKLGAFFTALSVFLQESKTDENILLYLIEHREQFNLYLGARTIENLLSRLFPAGPHELRAAIRQGYTQRGFATFYAQQESLLNALEWGNACMKH